MHAGIELFTFVSLWVIIVVLPTNLSVRNWLGHLQRLRMTAL